MRALVVGFALLAVAGCGGNSGGASSGEHATAVDPTAPRSITVTSPAFEEGSTIPSEFTCRGKGLSPPLAWTGVDLDKVSDLALVVDDPDAPNGGYVHWFVSGIKAIDDQLNAGEVPTGAHELAGTDGTGWRAPCPPSGTHHYRFTVYAFPSSSAFAYRTDLPLGEVLEVFADQAVAWGRLTGTVSAK
jgi:Raf kinase inhibitor-like YbhB/YbcL family protein